MLNKLLLGLVLFGILYYFSDRKNIAWCVYGVVAYIVVLICIEYLNDNNQHNINEQVSQKLQKMTANNNVNLKNATKTNKINTKNEIENYLNSEKIDSLQRLPVDIKYAKKSKKLPSPYNLNYLEDQKLDEKDCSTYDKLKQLNNDNDIKKYCKPDLNNIEVYNLNNYNNSGMSLDNADAYKYSVGNQLFYSMFAQ